MNIQIVMPAQAGIYAATTLDSRLRGNDNDMLRVLTTYPDTQLSFPIADTNGDSTPAHSSRDARIHRTRHADLRGDADDRHTQPRTRSCSRRTAAWENPDHSLRVMRQSRRPER